MSDSTDRRTDMLNQKRKARNWAKRNIPGNWSPIIDSLGRRISRISSRGRLQGTRSRRTKNSLAQHGTNLGESGIQLRLPFGDKNNGPMSVIDSFVNGPRKGGASKKRSKNNSKTRKVKK